MSHAALPGIVISFLITRSKAPLPLMLGALVAGWLGTLAIMSIVRTTRIKYDSALGFVLSVNWTPVPVRFSSGDLPERRRHSRTDGAGAQGSQQRTKGQRSRWPF